MPSVRTIRSRFAEPSRGDEYHLIARKSSRQHHGSKVAQERVMSPKVSQSLNLKNKVRTVSPVRPPHADLPIVFFKDVNKGVYVRSKAAEHQQQQHVKKTASKEEKLVKYMSKFPSYLKTGEIVPDKLLSNGVTDWEHFEKWKQNRISRKCDKTTSFMGSNSSTLTATSSSSSQFNSSKKINPRVAKPPDGKVNTQHSNKQGLTCRQPELYGASSGRKFNKAREKASYHRSKLGPRISSHLGNEVSSRSKENIPGLDSQGEARAVEGKGSESHSACEHSPCKKDSIILLLPKDFSRPNSSKISPGTSVDGISSELEWNGFFDVFSDEEIHSKNSLLGVHHHSPPTCTSESDSDLYLKLGNPISGQGIEIGSDQPCLSPKLDRTLAAEPKIMDAKSKSEKNNGLPPEAPQELKQEAAGPIYAEKSDSSAAPQLSLCMLESDLPCMPPRKDRTLAAESKITDANSKSEKDNGLPPEALLGLEQKAADPKNAERSGSSAAWHLNFCMLESGLPCMSPKSDRTLTAETRIMGAKIKSEKINGLPEANEELEQKAVGPLNAEKSDSPAAQSLSFCMLRSDLSCLSPELDRTLDAESTIMDAKSKSEKNNGSPEATDGLKQKAAGPLRAGKSDSSVARRLSFCMLGRSLRFRESAAVPRMSSTHLTSKSGPLRAEFCFFDSSHSNMVNPNSRARDSPLRRLLSPLLKHRAINLVGSTQSIQSSTDNTDDCSVGAGSALEGPFCDKSSTSTRKARLQLTVKGGLPLFKFLGTNNEILASTVKKLSRFGKDDPDWLYTFYSVCKVAMKSGSWKSQVNKHKNTELSYTVAGLMKVTDPHFLVEQDQVTKQTATEYVLYGADLNKTEESTPEFTPSKELAAIVVKMTNESLSTKHNNSNGNLSSGWSENAEENENTRSIVVILPKGMHGLPPEGGVPSPLISRWRSGGLCDCGGWDVGCGLHILTNGAPDDKTIRASRADWLQDRLDLFIQQGAAKQLKPIFSLVSHGKGVFSVEYDTAISSLQAFASCVAFLNKQKVTASLDQKCNNESRQKHEWLNTPEDNHGSGPAKYAAYPPLSPAGRV